MILDTMEQNIVQFITDNIMFFLPLGIIGIVSTIILYFTGARNDKNRCNKDTNFHIILLNRKFNYFFSIYIFIFSMILIIGFLSKFYLAAIIGGCIAFIPIIVLLFVEYTAILNKRKSP